MATFEQNLRKIRGESIYGAEVREAIAQALEQSDDDTITLLNQTKTLVENRELYINLTSLGDDNFRMEIVNASQS